MNWREEIIGDARLILGDCLEILPHIGRVDAVVTDVPYGISQDSNGLRCIDYGSWDKGDVDAVVRGAMEQLRGAPTVLAFCGNEQWSLIFAALGERITRALTWVKPNPTVMNGQHVFLPSSELAYYGKLSGAWFGGHCERSIWQGSPPKEREHPTQKPLALMAWCVANVCAPDAVTLDPFMGSGTTGVACMNLGRKFIGIEIEERYFDIACERISRAQQQGRLFDERPKPEQVSIL